MKSLLLLLVMIVCGCVTTLQEYQTCQPTEHLKTYQISHCGPQPPSLDFENYIASFEALWNDDPMFPYDPQKLRDALNSIVIFWQPRIFRAPRDEDGLLGLTYPPTDGMIRMYVYVPPNCADASCTSLGHELIHVAYGAISGDMYRGHLNDSPKWPQPHMEFLEKVRSAYLGL
jgi:hypothetical protein